MTTRIGVLTAGGDAPGLNAAIRAVVRTAIGAHGFEVLGFRRGWRGVMEGDVIELTSSSVQGILHRGGTILGSSGADPYHDQGVERVRRTFVDLGVDALVTIGGEGTMGAAATDLIAEGGFGQMVALHGDRIGEVPLAEAAKVRPVPEELVAVAELLFEERRRP